MKISEKQIQKAMKKKEELAKQYNVSVTSIVWVGHDHFIIVFGHGNELFI